jgi:hypothetical protein
MNEGYLILRGRRGSLDRTESPLKLLSYAHTRPGLKVLRVSFSTDGWAREKHDSHK